MTNISIQTAPSRMIAAVRRQVRIGEVGSAWKPALDQVWKFLGHNPGLRQDGHNVFLYHHPASRQSPMEVDFGVEVIRRFERAGEVYLVESPAGKVVTALHVGSYAGLRRTHDAIHSWAAENNVKFAGKSWEIYGDWTNDETKLETRIEYLLA